MLASCFDQRTTNSRRCSMGDVSFQGTNPPRVRTVGVTHALGPFCYPCARLVPIVLLAQGDYRMHLRLAPLAALILVATACDLSSMEWSAYIPKSLHANTLANRFPG